MHIILIAFGEGVAYRADSLLGLLRFFKLILFGIMFSRGYLDALVGIGTKLQKLFASTTCLFAKLFYLLLDAVPSLDGIALLQLPL